MQPGSLLPGLLRVGKLRGRDPVGGLLQVHGGLGGRDDGNGGMEAGVERRAFRGGPADLQLPRLLAQGAAHEPEVRAAVVQRRSWLQVVGLAQAAVDGRG